MIFHHSMSILAVYEEHVDRSLEEIHSYRRCYSSCLAAFKLVAHVSLACKDKAATPTIPSSGHLLRRYDLFTLAVDLTRTVLPPRLAIRLSYPVPATFDPTSVLPHLPSQHNNTSIRPRRRPSQHNHGDHGQQKAAERVEQGTQTTHSYTPVTEAHQTVLQP